MWPASNPAGLQVGGAQTCASEHTHLPQATPLGKAIMRSSQATWQGQLHRQVAAGTQAQRERTLAGSLIFPPSHSCLSPFILLPSQYYCTFSTSLYHVLSLSFYLCPSFGCGLRARGQVAGSQSGWLDAPCHT